ncbi:MULTISPECIES: winged helix-turn-helix transcriptional regulator [Vibrio]|uniref:Transcriptional regulator n=2 Tax=Vibrio TaxID=662 RepID=A0A7X4RWU6_9VIBR|nr:MULTISPECIES: helix-turn-helix domain-containing protein [Vibrio]MBF9003041.1 helix-turn-helix transcriptional regulator [Vibrio nitrifigilis]MZI96098.1 transcriptional regulator [Vibrio eleionomae]
MSPKIASNQRPRSLYEQVKKGNVLEKACPSREVLRDVTNRWGVLAILALTEETLRFSELRRKISGISEKMLSQTLQSLEADGFVNRIAYPVVPPHVEYSLTPMGEEVSSRIRDLTGWIEDNLSTIMLHRAEYSQNIAK